MLTPALTLQKPHSFLPWSKRGASQGRPHVGGRPAAQSPRTPDIWHPLVTGGYHAHLAPLRGSLPPCLSPLGPLCHLPCPHLSMPCHLSSLHLNEELVSSSLLSVFTLFATPSWPCLAHSSEKTPNPGFPSGLQPALDVGKATQGAVRPEGPQSHLGKKTSR